MTLARAKGITRFVLSGLGGSEGGGGRSVPTVSARSVHAADSPRTQRRLRQDGRPPGRPRRDCHVKSQAPLGQGPSLLRQRRTRFTVGTACPGTPRTGGGEGLGGRAAEGTGRPPDRAPCAPSPGSRPGGEAGLPHPRRSEVGPGHRRPREARTGRQPQRLEEAEPWSPRMAGPDPRNLRA